MDTPDRSKIGTPVSKFEDSPVFSFINSLSPIQPVESGHAAQTFHSLSFASITSIFTSPHVNLQKESRCLVRHSFSELPKNDISADDGGEGNLCNGEAIACKPSGDTSTVTCTLTEATVDPPDESSDAHNDLPKPEPFDCGSPNHNTTPLYVMKSDFKLDIGRTPAELVQYIEDGQDKGKLSFVTGIEFRDRHQLELGEGDTAGCDWEKLICDGEDNLLIFDPSHESEGCKGPDEKPYDSDIKPSASYLSYLQRDFVDDSSSEKENSVLLTRDAKEVEEQCRTDDMPQFLPGNYHNDAVTSEGNVEMCNESMSVISLACNVQIPQQRGTRRRCLNFEVYGDPKVGLQSDLTPHNAVLLPSNSDDDKQQVRPKIGNPSPCLLPGIGLHLNALATTSRDRLCTREALVTGRRLISLQNSSGPLSPTKTGQKADSKSLPVPEDLGFSKSETEDLKIMQEDAPLPVECGSNKALRQSSPKKKKRKLEIGAESDGCRRCNCKKSKCLKLYCECFAAGVYCVEPCSCQGCFNKPIHEETVLNTRKTIESRNPLAFAPKVIRASDSFQDTGEEANKTPASARHKRGCNCKKSNCLKKYCECYQGRVGCSVSCRCEGCKNAFGTKDGIMPMDNEEFEHEGGKKDAFESDKPDEGQSTADIQDEHLSSESILQLTPFEIFRSSADMPLFSTGKDLRSLAVTVGGGSSCSNHSTTLGKCKNPLSQCDFGKHGKLVLEDDTPAILRGNASPINCVKSSSPNQKRVSPPHIGTRLSPNRKGGRKLILKSIPSFPSLNCEQ